MDRIKNIVLIGAGNVSAHLAKALIFKGFTVVQVVNRSEKSGRKLAGLIKASYTGSLDQVHPGADMYILAVSDSALPEISSRLSLSQGIVVHTSGSVGMNVLQSTSPNIGVLYPLQTFRSGKKSPFQHIPFCVEGNSTEVEQKLVELAGMLSDNVHVINSEQRMILHLTAVFAGNFTNYLFTVAEDLLRQYDLPFELIKPLIKQTAANIRHTDLFKLQTGPALREDMPTIEKHLKLLENHKEYQEIYHLISKQIIHHKYRNDKL
ncbi:MAG: DUF2520 domain-containing protein [Bacteroidales bacterium]|nr:DUF2520 domain-containing protein [Bacteroidales bacterium]